MILSGQICTDVKIVKLMCEIYFELNIVGNGEIWVFINKILKFLR